MNLFDKHLFCCWVKAHVGNCGEKSFQHEPVSLFVDGITLFEGNPRQVYQGSCNLVLQVGGLFFLSANSHASCTGLSASSLFALITKHVMLLQIRFILGRTFWHCQIKVFFKTKVILQFFRRWKWSPPAKE